MSWNQMKTSKHYGGMGFWGLESFNLELFAKQFWRVISRTNTLVATILKEKYFKEGNVLEGQGKAIILLYVEKFISWQKL